MFQSLIDLVSGSPWTYGYLFAVCAVDAFFPLVPSETSVVTAGVLAATGKLNVGLVVAVSALGAIAGDHVSYVVGRTFGERVANRYFTGKRKRHLERAERMLRERGGYLIVIGRFIPGGRTAITFASGLLGMRWRRFFAYDLAAGWIWASYATLIGYFGGKAFEDDPTKALLVALGVALGIAAIVELIRWLRRRGRVGPAPRPGPEAATTDGARD